MPTDRHAAGGLPAIDADLLDVLRRTAEIETQSASWKLPEAERRRLVSERAAAMLPRASEPGVERTDLYAVSAGREIPIRLYRRAGGDAARAPLMLYAHGGGWVVGSIATHDTLCAELAACTGHAVASVHYRRAPEHPHPAQHEDLWEAGDWLLRHARALGLDGDSPMAVAGDSAGAHLALGVAWRAQRQTPGRYGRQLLFYPALDPGLGSDSVRLYADGPGLTRAAMQYYWRSLLGEDATGDAHRAALPMRWQGSELALPPTVLVTAETDVLRDEGEAFASRLLAAGVPLRHWRADGMIHGFARMLAASAAARAHVRRACEAFVELGGGTPALR
ncbi:alpha/beta hydrolase [Bordetella genomosp. 13]|uniref:alpha/beta hydrolase n=1 Tax=Bordetella genomosp. 13 TaxID=463040 RepID=UPI0012FA837B|nr:alpha/beta hydrolase [Bordetella genomosp. 13]